MPGLPRLGGRIARGEGGQLVAIHPRAVLEQVHVAQDRVAATVVPVVELTEGTVPLREFPGREFVEEPGHTVQGAANTPGTIKRAVDERKQNKNQEQSTQEETKTSEING